MEDQATLDVIHQILELQRYLFQLWEGGFERAIDAGEVPDEYYNVQAEVERLEGSLGEGGGEVLGAKREQMQRMEQAAHVRLEGMYNRVLRRLSQARSLLLTMQA